MIKIYGSQGTKEYKAAEDLRDLINNSCPRVKASGNEDIHIVANVKCPNGPSHDVDLVVFINMCDPTRVDLRNDVFNVEPKRLCFTIEVKSHSFENVHLHESQVDVYYKNNPQPTDAAYESLNQRITVAKYVKNVLKETIWVYNLIWLRNYPSSLIPNHLFQVVGSDAGWLDFLRALVRHQEDTVRERCMYPVAFLSSRNGTICRENDPLFDEARQIFTYNQEPTKLDRKRMEKMCQPLLSNQEYAKAIGNQIVVFKGCGGTGKTMRLIRVAHDLYEQQDARVLVLTYNKALVSDITRLMNFMNIPSKEGEPCIKIRTIHSHLRELFESFNYDVTTDYIGRYDSLKNRFLAETSGMSSDELFSLADKKNVLSYQYVLIDEVQDWPENERDILFNVYGLQKLIIADGVDQLVREHGRTEWYSELPKEQKKVTPLTQSLRLKQSLCDFVNVFAEQIGYEGWRVQKLKPVANIYGGRIIVIEGTWSDYARNRDVHEERMRVNNEDGNKNVDALFCVPRNLTGKMDGKHYSYVAETFKNWDYAVWDGVNEDIRDSYPNTPKHLRILPYTSCRGLEGWTVVNFEFDTFYDKTIQDYKSSPQEQEKMHFDEKEAAHQYAIQWLMIPVTRAIDTLVIQIADSQSFVGKALWESKKSLGELIEWRKLT